MKNKFWLVGATVVVIVGLFWLATSLYQSRQAENLNFMARENSQLFVPPHAIVLGKEDASVYLVEFLDPECESCRQFYPYVKRLMSVYQNDLKLVIRYAPFHKNSKNAIRVIEAARKQGKYWETLGILFETQPEWADHHNPQPEKIWDIIAPLGLDIDQLKSDMQDPQITAIIDQDIADGQTLGVRQTPTFFVNGTPLQDFGYEPLYKLIQSKVEAIKGSR